MVELVRVMGALSLMMTAREISVAMAIQNWRVRPFVRGTGDCCAFANHVVHQLTGMSYIPDYHNDEEKDAILAACGGLSAALTHWMRREPIPTEELSPGDVVFLTIMDYEAIGVLVNERKAATVFKDGMPRMVSAGFVDHGWSAWQ